jgi:hypothetical protein
MNPLVTVQRARIAALIAAALAALGCGEAPPLTAPALRPPAASDHGTRGIAPITAGTDPRLSGYALASGRIDTLSAPHAK